MMTVLETNVFPITNLHELSSRFRLAEISGLHSDQAEYYQNRQILERRLSLLLKKPVLVIERNGLSSLVLPEEVTALPAEIPLVRVVAQLKLGMETFAVDYTQRSPEADRIALRFLRFLIQAPLYRDPRLWQPAAGRPFFPRRPDRVEQGIQHFAGFSVRPVEVSGGGLGLCVDPVSCYVGELSIPAHLTRDEFVRSWKGRNCLYRFGEYWYEIRLHALADRTVSNYLIPVDRQTCPLLDYLLARVSRPIPTDLAELSEDAAVVLYLNSRGEEMAAPAPLCYPTFDTSSDQVAAQHRRAILPPEERRRVTHRLVQTYLHGLKFGEVRLQLGENPVAIPRQMVTVPDLRFGKGVVLSVRGTPGAVCANLSELGDRRLSLLRDPTVGPYLSAPLDRQYLVLPRSVHDSFGPQFATDLASEVERFMPEGGGYIPTIVSFDDRGPRSFARQGLAVREAVERACKQPGYALVMVHRTQDRKPRDEDQLAAMVVQEMRDRLDVRAAVIHSEVTRRSYREVRRRDGALTYQCSREQRGRLAGYLRNVALSKILLTNQRWPFVLATPLYADVTIGIDVKNNTCGLLIVGNHGSEIHSELKTSRQKERLLAPQLATYLVEILQKEANARGAPLSSIVFHRDGRSWPSELRGVSDAVRRLRADGYLSEAAQYAVVEISKTSPAPLRLYYLHTNGQRPIVANPSVGCLYRVSEREAFLCSTGHPFLRQGTAHPLHLKLVQGSISFEKCLSDLYALTALAWTQPEGCMRYPITIKLNDRILGVEAADYDSDAIEFGGSSSVDEEDTNEGIA
jgi:hypothetical protein